MNGKDLLIGMGYINAAYFEEAETASLSPSQPRSLRRPLLVAALIAAMLLLVGCALVYALRLQDMSVGQETYIQRFDENGKYIDPVEKTKDILVFTAPGNDAQREAMLEWHAFLETYDPEGKLMTNDPQLPQIPDRYEYTYSCYTQEMVEKVDEIAEKYSLKLLDTWLPFQHYQSGIFLEETGIGSFLLPDSDAEIKTMAGMLYPPYNFHMEFSLVTEADPNGLLSSITYERNDYFPRSFMGSSLDLSSMDQWDHVTRDGTQVLLALSSKGQGYIIGESGNGMVHIFIDGNRSRSAYPGEGDIITKAELEAMADLFDYSLEPEEIDREAVEARLKQTEEAYFAENAYVPEVYESFNEYLKKRVYLNSPRHQYTFYDLNGDGMEDLLLGYEGSCNEVLTVGENGIEMKMFGGFYLCEGAGFENGYVSEGYYDYEEHDYYAPVSDTAVFSQDWQGSGEPVVRLVRKQHQWYRREEIDFQFVETPISEAEATAICAQYPRLNLDWKPLAEYPLDDSGFTLGRHLMEKDVRVTDGELLDIYKNFLSEEAGDFYTHCRIQDVNGDGVDDLLLSGNGEFYWDVYTYRYGDVIHVYVGDFFLCENNVLATQSRTTDYLDTGVEVELQEFVRLQDFEKETLAVFAYNKATASWQSDFYGTPMPEAEVNAILAKYPRIDQRMQEIDQLLNG